MEVDEGFQEQPAEVDVVGELVVEAGTAFHMGSMMTGGIKTTQDRTGMGTQKDLVMTEIMIADTAEIIEAVKVVPR